MEKLTKKDIISNIAEDSHLSKKDITEVVDLALTQIFEGLSEGKTVDLAGFGKFEITERKAREGFNPLTKEKIQIEASKSVKFKVAKALKEAVNKFFDHYNSLYNNPFYFDTFFHRLIYLFLEPNQKIFLKT